jgi:hypothetical protein
METRNQLQIRQAEHTVAMIQQDQPPSMYVVMNGKIPLEMYPSKELAEAALQVLNFKTGLSLLTIKPFWG